MSSVINTVALVIIAVSVFWTLIFRKRSLMRFIFLVCGVTVAFVGTLVLKSLLSGYAQPIKEALIAYLGTENTVSQLLGASTTSLDTLIGIAGAISAPILFFVLFIAIFIVCLVIRIIIGIIMNIVSQSDKEPKLIKSIIVGALSGVILLTCVFVPVSAYSSLATKTLPAIKENGMLSEESIADVESVVFEVESSKAIQVYRTLGGKYIDSLLMGMKVKVGEETFKTALDDEAVMILGFLDDINIITSKPIEQYTENETAVLQGIGTSLTQSKVLASVASDFIGGAANAWDNGQSYLGIERPSFDPTFDPLIHKSISILGNDAGNIDYLKEDLDTVANMLTKIVAYLPKGSDGAVTMDAVMTKGLIKDLLTIVNENPRMRPLIPVITNIGLSILAENLGISPDSEAAYNKLVSDIAAELKASASLDADTRFQNMVNAINAGLIRQEITNVGESEVAIISMAIISHFDGVHGKTPSEVSNEDVSAFFDELTDAISTQDGTGSSPVVADGEYTLKPLAQSTSFPKTAGQLISGIIAVQIDASLSETQKQEQIASLLNNSEIFTDTSISQQKTADVIAQILSDANREPDRAKIILETVSGLVPNGEKTAFKHTAEKLLIDIEAFEAANVTKEEMQSFINGIADAFEGLAAINSPEGGDVIKDVCTGLGSLLDSLAANEKIYGEEKTEELVTVIFKSELIKNTVGMGEQDIENILSAKKEGDVSYSAFMGGMASMADTLESIKGGTEITEESIGALIDSLSTENCGSVISALITEEKIANMGFADSSPEAIKSVTELLGSIITNVSVANSQNNTAEADAIKNVISIASAASSTVGQGGDAFGENGRLGGVTAGQMIDSFMASESVSKALCEVEIVYNPFGMQLSGNDSILLREAINERLEGADETAVKTLNAIAKLLGV